jgi:hypothetical protein
LTAAFVVAVAATSSRVLGAPNGLNQIPIAKVYGDGGIASSFATSDLGGSSSFATFQYGLYNIAELGVDWQTSPSDQRAALLNGKLLLLHKPGGLPDVAVGFENVATNRQAVPYIVATTQPRLFGFSLGAIRPAGEAYHAMGGLSYNATNNLQVVADLIGGVENFTSIGVIDNVTPQLQFNAAYAQPNSGSAGGPGYIFSITYIFHLKNGGISHGKDLSRHGGVIKTPGGEQNGSGDHASTPATAPGANSL